MVMEAARQRFFGSSIHGRQRVHDRYFLGVFMWDIGCMTEFVECLWWLWRLHDRRLFECLLGKWVTRQRNFGVFTEVGTWPDREILDCWQG